MQPLQPQVITDTLDFMTFETIVWFNLTLNVMERSYLERNIFMSTVFSVPGEV